MPIYARIQDGAVAELLDTTAPIETLFHPALQWVAVVATEAPPGVAIGWRHSLAGFQPPPAEGVPPGAAELHAHISDLAAEVTARLS
jgi:hypothetical protein